MEYGDARTAVVKEVHQWSAEWWLSSTGEMVDYFLIYSYPEHATPDLRHLHVAAMKIPAVTVSHMLPPARIQQLTSLAAPPDLAPRLTAESFKSTGLAKCAAQ